VRKALRHVEGTVIGLVQPRRQCVGGRSRALAQVDDDIENDQRVAAYEFCSQLRWILKVHAHATWLSGVKGDVTPVAMRGFEPCASELPAARSQDASRSSVM